MQLLTEEMKKKWNPILEHKDLAPITDAARKKTTTVLLENEEKFLKEDTSTANVDRQDAILIDLVRRSAPNMLAYDLCGVQPMNQPTALVFALRALTTATPTPGPYGKPGDARPGYQEGGSQVSAWEEAGVATYEAFYNEANTAYSGTGTHNVSDPSNPSIGTGMSTEVGEHLGRGLSGDEDFGAMSFTIEKVNTAAKTRALKSEFSLELQQDLKAVHGLDAEKEIADMLSVEILAEINREVVWTIRKAATLGSASPLYSNGSLVRDSNGDIQYGAAGVFDLEQNSDGRWSAEKYKSLMIKIETEANQVAKKTRRGRANFIVCSSDVASVLDMAGKLIYAPALDNSLNVDDTGNTFVGVLNGKYKVYIDPFLTYNEVIVGYRGKNQYDAGMFYCPYVPLQMVKAINPNTFQPSMAFKTRYSIVSNPFTTLTQNKNVYYRKFRVVGL